MTAKKPDITFNDLDELAEWLDTHSGDPTVVAVHDRRRATPHDTGFFQRLHDTLCSRGYSLDPVQKVWVFEENTTAMAIRGSAVDRLGALGGK